MPKLLTADNIERLRRVLDDNTTERPWLIEPGDPQKPIVSHCDCYCEGEEAILWANSYEMVRTRSPGDFLLICEAVNNLEALLDTIQALQAKLAEVRTSVNNLHGHALDSQADEYIRATECILDLIDTPTPEAAADADA